MQAARYEQKGFSGCLQWWKWRVGVEEVSNFVQWVLDFCFRWDGLKSLAWHHLKLELYSGG